MSLIARALYFVGRALVWLCILPLGIVVGILVGVSVGVSRLWRWCELHAVYGGDKEAQERDNWKTK